MDLWLAPHDFRIRTLRKLSYGFAATALGDCMALATESHLMLLSFIKKKFEAVAELQAKWPKVTLSRSAAVEQLITLAFTNPKEISVLAIGTPFQLSIWELLRTIPSGSTMTYGEVACAIGRPQAARAVGQAVGANEISMVIPCHRIVSRGKLTGYRWGLERKRQLLASELVTPNLLA